MQAYPRRRAQRLLLPGPQLLGEPRECANTADGSRATRGTRAPASIHVRTDVLDMDISLQGGQLTRADLLRYPLQKKQPDIKVRLFNDSPAEPLYVLQSGLTVEGNGARPDHLATYDAPASEYTLVDGQQELKIPLTWSNDAGVTVTKTYTFQRGNYAIHLDYSVNNQSSAAWSGASYLQILRQQHKVERSMFNVESYAFSGPAVYDGTRYQKLKIDDEDDRNLNATVTDGWLASMQHHFVAASRAGREAALSVPPSGQGRGVSVRRRRTDAERCAWGHASFGETVFVGPKLQAQLEPAGPRLELVADYGKLTFIAKPLFGLLSWVHGLVGNWGWSIIMVTALIKLLFYWPSQVSGKSMAKMRALTPRIKNIQERYKDDREQLGRATMDLYKREKVNPLAGCMPILIQIPVFLAFYWVLLESVEMRQAPFLLWINDLSVRDPYFILPLIMGGGDVRSVQTQSHATRSNPGESLHVHAAHHDFHVRAGFPRAWCSTGSRTPRCRLRSNGTSIA